MQLEIVGCRLKIANFRLQIADLCEKKTVRKVINKKSCQFCLPERPNGLGRSGQSCLILKNKNLVSP
jgi:hypothetical protein